MITKWKIKKLKTEMTVAMRMVRTRLDRGQVYTNIRLRNRQKEVAL